mmetsp:Transcript_60793/g.100452  ORF Transcript_60793/g.100452 Transcript_60793/m.100452 type:complete len:201 (-) Transcript_60793:456-1058(-)
MPEDERQVAGDALLLQLPGGLDPLPRRREFDEDAGLVDAVRLVQVDDAAGPREGGLLVEAEPGVDLRRHIPGHDRGDPRPEGHRQDVHRQLHLRLNGVRGLARGRHGLIHHRDVVRVPREPGLRHEQRVCRRVRDGPRLGVLLDSVEVTAVDGQHCHGGELLELLDLGPCCVFNTALASGGRSHCNCQALLQVHGTSHQS